MAFMNRKGNQMREAKVLLVDDEVTLTRHLSLLLSKRGYAVTCVNDGESAVAAIEDSEFDVAVLDLKMPGINGMETLKIIKK